MKLIFPVESNLGLETPLYGHFGSAPHFLVVDSDTRSIDRLINRDRHHAHGACQPGQALAGMTADGVVLTSIGGRALAGLRQLGLKVFRAEGSTVGEALDAYVAGKLQEMDPAAVCGGHAHGHGHGGCCS